MTKKDASLTAQQVAQYLEENLDFFKQHPQTLSKLDIPHQNGGAISLVERQVALLREQNIDLRHRHADVIETAKANEQLFEKTKTLSLALINTHSLVETVGLLEQILNTEFNADCFSLTFFNTHLTFSHPLVNLTEKSIAQEFIPNFIGTQRPICGALRADASAFFFKKQAALIGSAAVIPLRHKDLEGYLSIGSFNEDHFHAKIGTLFISYMGELLSRVFHQHFLLEDAALRQD